jgi:hypothetical protein
MRIIKSQFLNQKQTNMNKLKTLQEKRNEQYKAESLSGKWFWYIMGAALLLTALIENL